jgi:hypothetical protein
MRRAYGRHERLAGRDRDVGDRCGQGQKRRGNGGTTAFSRGVTLDLDLFQCVNTTLVLQLHIAHGRDKGMLAQPVEGSCMFRCILCQLEIELDDAVAPTSRGRCVCLRCYFRILGNRRPMPGWLSDAIRDCLANNI